MAEIPNVEVVITLDTNSFWIAVLATGLAMRTMYGRDVWTEALTTIADFDNRDDLAEGLERLSGLVDPLTITQAMSAYLTAYATA